MLTSTGDATDPRGVMAVNRRVPSGPRGLWGALASAVTPRVAARTLPLSDVSTLGVITPGMFAYDPALASSLGEELDPGVLLP
jgi:hypothetical protein